MKLGFTLSSCIRASSVSSQCQKCVDICPVDTIQITNNIPTFTPDECVLCGGCIGSCPTSAFAFDDFSIIEFAFDFFENTKPLSCHSNAPCLAIFGAEVLTSLALGSNENVILDIGHCKTCEIATKLYPQIQNNINEANFILSTFCNQKIEALDLKLQDIKEEVEGSSRRDFFANLKPTNLIKSKITLEETIDGNEAKIFNFTENTINQIKNKTIPDTRKLFFTLLKNQNKPKVYETIDSDEISFMSQKYIDSKCTNCQMCYRICPTEALSSDANHSVINFNSMLCLKCHLCHDVCSYDAIHMQKAFDIKEFFEPTKKSLAIFDIKRCNECDNTFTYFGGEVICPRCKTEEDEALTLHNIFKKDLL